MGILLFILILSFLVLIHELGHFLVAKRMGVIVEEFGLGYPPKALKLFRKWGTDFTLNWIPFGGFVKMKGEFADADTESVMASKSKNKKAAELHIGEFSGKRALPRLAIILAGAAVNFVYGVLAFCLVFSFMGIPATQAIISEVQPGSPAEQVGLTPKTKITEVQIDDKTVATPTYPEVSELLRTIPGKTVTLRTVGPCDGDKCQDNYKNYTVQLRPADQVNDSQGPLGVAFETKLFYPWYIMPFKGALFGIEQALLLGWAIIQGLGTMISQLVTRGVVPQDVAGPVGIVHQAQTSGLFTQGIGYIILFSGMLSINLAIMNVLPIPALDGGRALFILLEKLFGKKWVAKVEGYANYGGFVVLLILIGLVTIRDVMRIIHP